MAAIPIELRTTIPSPEAPSAPSSKAPASESFATHLKSEPREGPGSEPSETAEADVPRSQDAPSEQDAPREQGTEDESANAAPVDKEEKNASEEQTEEPTDELAIRDGELEQELLDAADEADVDEDESDSPQDATHGVVADVTTAPEAEVIETEIGTPVELDEADPRDGAKAKQDPDSGQGRVPADTETAEFDETAKGALEASDTTEEASVPVERRTDGRKKSEARPEQTKGTQSADQGGSVDVEALGLTPVDIDTAERSGRSSRRQEKDGPSPLSAASDAASGVTKEGGEASAARNQTPPPVRFGEQLLQSADKSGAAKPVELTGPQQSRFVERVARAFQAAEGRGGPIRLRLHPPELGSVRLEMRIQDGAISARVEAETASARTLLIENIPILRERLAEQGLRIEQFDVGLEQHGGTGPEVPEDRDSSSGNQRREERPSEIVDEPAATSRTPWKDDTGLDIVI